MLTKEEKKEMLEDAKSASRRQDFRVAKAGGSVSFDQYLNFLNNVQDIFGSFKESRQPTKTSLNKL
jgi:hypothetical protein